MTEGGKTFLETAIAPLNFHGCQSDHRPFPSRVQEHITRIWNDPSTQRDEQWAKKKGGGLKRRGGKGVPYKKRRKASPRDGQLPISDENTIKERFASKDYRMERALEGKKV